MPTQPKPAAQPAPVPAPKPAPPTVAAQPVQPKPAAQPAPVPAPKPAPPAPSPEDLKSAALLKSAGEALTQKNPGAAVERYRQFVREFPQRKEINSVRYSLAVALFELPNRDFAPIIEALTPAAADATLPERPAALYLLALSQKTTGTWLLEQAANKPAAEAQKLRTDGTTLLEQAQQNFGVSAALYAARMPAGNPPAMTGDLEWSLRARCDQADALLRMGRPKEAIGVLDGVLKSPPPASGQSRSLATLTAGLAHVQLGDDMAAIRHLAALAPFNQQAIGLRARYLLASIHAKNGQWPEAAMQLEAVIAGIVPEQHAVDALIKNPEAFRMRPEEKLRYETSLRESQVWGPRAMFDLACVLQEQGKLPDAIVRFAQYLQTSPRGPQAIETRMRQAVCFVQNKQGQEALRALNGLQDDPAVGDQALLWQSRAVISAANVADPRAADQSYAVALDHLRRAAAKAAAIQGDTPEIKARKGEILLDMARTHELLRQYKEASGVFGKAQLEGSPEQAEIALQRQAIVLGLAGLYKESEDLCAKFAGTYPQSPLLPEVLLRQADNTYNAAVLSPAAPADPARRAMFADAAKRYAVFVTRFPEHPGNGAGRFGLGSSYYNLGELPKAIEALKGIPEPERVGPLAAASYLMGDAILRSVPPITDDAIAINRALEQLEEATKHLGSFVASNENSPQTPDALLKLGMAFQKQAGVLADAAERRKAYESAQQAYNKVVGRFPKHPAFAAAVFENAKLLAELGDVNNAVGQLGRFTQDPLKASPLAPAALATMGQFMLKQGRAAEAVNLLQQARQAHEPQLAADPSRVEMLAQLQLAHAMALKAAGKTPEALAILESISKQFAARPEGAEAAWRLAQARRDDLAIKTAAAWQAVVAARGNAQQLAPAQQAFDTSLAALRAVGEEFAKKAADMEKADAPAEQRARVLAEATTTARRIGEIDLAALKGKLEQEAIAKIANRIAAEKPSLQPPPSPRAPEIKLTLLPLTAGETRMLQLAGKLFDDLGDTQAANEVRAELIEFYMGRQLWDKALPLLNEQMTRDPAPNAADRWKLKVADCLIRKGEAAKALQLVDPMLQNRENPNRPAAIAVAGECHLMQKNWASVVERMTRFRDVSQYNGVPGVSDRGMIQLAQALIMTNSWDAARQTCEALLQRFPQSPRALEARFNAGYALQKMGQFDPAIRNFEELSKRDRTELAARAQLQIGLCRMEQKKFAEALQAFLTVVYCHEYPELTATARIEASRALEAMKQAPQAKEMIQRVLAENPQGPWNSAAQKRLAEIK
ncbi:MAG: tetratricopeptide repeat protein [Tepidisphaerales bacterium]